MVTYVTGYSELLSERMMKQERQKVKTTFATARANSSAQSRAVGFDRTGRKLFLLVVQIVSLKRF